MELNLKKPLVFFDLETTGVNYSHDKIVELSYVKVMPNGKEQEDTMRFNPGMHIPEQATAVHHITDADVANCPTFKERAKEIAKVFEGCDIAGYNSNRFDVPMLIEEFLNAGVNFDYTKCRFVDVQTIFHKMEQRTLVAAYKFYCHKDLTKAHSAEADTMATYEVLMAQLDKYNQESVEKGEYPIAIQNNIEWLADFSTKSKFVDYAGRIILNEKGEKIINFGKHKGKTVESVFETEPSYHAWIMNGDFTMDTKHQFDKIYMEVLKKKNGSSILIK